MALRASADLKPTPSRQGYIHNVAEWVLAVKSWWVSSEAPRWRTLPPNVLLEVKCHHSMDFPTAMRRTWGDHP